MLVLMTCYCLQLMNNKNTSNMIRFWLLKAIVVLVGQNYIYIAHFVESLIKQNDH